MAGPHKWDGTISGLDFCEAARTFSQRWKEVNPTLTHWVWIPRPMISGSAIGEGVGYLSLENMCHQRSTEDLVVSECCSADEEQSVDCATLNDNRGTHFYDYHILYNFSYNVPVLYFRGYQYDGQPLPLERVKEDFPPHSSSILKESRWTFLTTEDHPFLRRPWHMLHPCGTRDWMKLLFSCSHLSESEAVRQYLPSWLSVVGQVVGFNLPLAIHEGLSSSPVTNWVQPS
ncbi:unnamed protein product [Spirodela intermedia]|uniref:Ubiquitin-like-conjugating enzyme ATG10 n=1 Tax=Spirodela intermedia TaxID=51605 RepID=A0A7I8JF30_SPIIN|nr:unnamed protein product [Spirodela intermedia]CAA6668143.1 unnamed protein product [Spirodela intermedia]